MFEFVFDLHLYHTTNVGTACNVRRDASRLISEDSIPKPVDCNRVHLIYTKAHTRTVITSRNTFLFILTNTHSTLTRVIVSSSKSHATLYIRK